MEDYPVGSNKNKRVLLTGASGTLGYNVARLLQADDRYLLYLPLRSDRPDLFPPQPRLTTFRLDLRDVQGVRDGVRAFQPEVVIHCAASGLRPPKPAWFEMNRFNVDATLALFEACCALPTCHFIYISTGLVYREQGRPLNELDPIETMHPYGASKAAADCLLRAAALEFGRHLSLLRPFSFTGQHDGEGRLFPSLLQSAVRREPFLLSPGEQIRDFCAVRDIARAIAATVETSPVNQVQTLNLGSGNSESLRELVTRVCDEIGLDVDLRFGGRPYHPFEPLHLVADTRKARETLGWAPAENVAYSVWELANQEAPELDVVMPRRQFTPRKSAL